MDKELELKLIAESRFCVACKHVATTYAGDPSTFRCMAPQNLDTSTINLVTGNYDKTWKYGNCHTARNNANGCGAEGKWWEPKPVEPPLRAEGDRSINKESKKKLGSISSDDL